MPAAAAQPLHLALLEDAQELRLRHQRQVADLVEEQGPAVGQFDPSEPPLVRAGEGALLVAEDLGLEQRIGNGRTADGLERPRLPAAQIVDGAGGHFLAGAGGPEDQYRDVGLGGCADRLEHQEHLLVAANQLEEFPHRRGLAAADRLDRRRQEAGEQAVRALVGRSRRAVAGRDAVPSACDAGADQRLETPLGIPAHAAGGAHQRLDVEPLVTVRVEEPQQLGAERRPDQRAKPVGRRQGKPLVVWK